MKSLFMESTKIEATKTVTEIQYLLAQAGATGTYIEYDGVTREPASLAFKMKIADREIPFLLPARAAAIFNVLQKRRAVNFREKWKIEDRMQAHRVAWRQILRWVQAQIALVETGMAEMVEVFMPYIQTGVNQTLFQKVRDGKFQGLLTE